MAKIWRNRDFSQIPAGRTDVVYDKGKLHVPWTQSRGFLGLLWWGYWSSSNPLKTGLSGSGCCSHLLFYFTPRCAMEPDRPGPSTWFITPSWWTTKIKPTELSNKPSLQFISLGVSKNIRMGIQRQSDQGPLQKKYQGTLLRMICTQRLLRFRWRSKNDHPLSESGRKLTGVSVWLTESIGHIELINQQDCS